MRRRRILEGLCALGLGAPALGRADEADDAAAAAPPAGGDLLVFAWGEREGQVITPADLVSGSPQIVAYPLDPVREIARNATRLNQILLVRLDPAWLSEETRARAADGIVAYSGVCTHTGCDIELWDETASNFQCPCHESQFDPSDGARVVGGPAPWQLAALPLAIDDGRLVVAGEFIGRVGFQQPGLDPFGF